MIKRLKNKLSRLVGKKTIPFTSDVFIDKKFIIGSHTYGVPRILFENDEANLIVGKYCSFAEGVRIFLGGNHRLDWISTYPFGEIYKKEVSVEISGSASSKGDVKIENDVWIGFNSTIMSGVKISNGAVIAACSVVTKDVGPYEIWAGNPAKFIRKRFDEKNIEKLLNIEWWDLPHEDVLNFSKELSDVSSDDLENKINELS
jgi:acetyltransferase-like isoleucine patch superfamily enzyme